MTKTTISLQDLRARIGRRAKSAPAHRFWGMYVHLVKLDTLEASYLEAKRNRGAPGIDGETFEQIERRGRGAFLANLASELRNGNYSPDRYRRKEIPKEGGKTRVISIPTIRDRVVQGALRLILEPIFEADFSDSSYGARPGRSAHQAVEVVRAAIQQRKHLVADVDLARYFDDIRHDRVLGRVAQRVQDGRVLALLKRILKSVGAQGLPQGSPLSPLLANVMPNDLDHALDRGRGFLTYVRYLDDMVILVPDSERGQRWAERAVERIREEAGAIGVSVNEDKAHVTTMTEAKAVFTFLGFEFRWRQSLRTRWWYASMSPQPRKVIDVLRRVREVLRRSRALPMQAAVAQVNSILRGWVNYFRVGNSAKVFRKVRNQVESKVRRFAAKKRNRKGFGWNRWSSNVVYRTWGLFDDYQVMYGRRAKVRNRPNRTITPM